MIILMNKLLIILLILMAVCFSGGCFRDYQEKVVSPNKSVGTVKQEKAEKSPGIEFYTVVRVIDGDTIIVNFNGRKERVRLIGINTPEINQPGKAGEPYGRKAADFMQRLLRGKRVKLVFDIGTRDKYGRLLAYVYLSEGTFVNAKLVSEGYAQVMTVPPNVRYADEFVKLQRKAREAGRGLWGKRN
jgi:micrococcal nuclease